MRIKKSNSYLLLAFLFGFFLASHLLFGQINKKSSHSQTQLIVKFKNNIELNKRGRNDITVNNNNNNLNQKLKKLGSDKMVRLIKSQSLRRKNRY